MHSRRLVLPCVPTLVPVTELVLVACIGVTLTESSISYATIGGFEDINVSLTGSGMNLSTLVTGKKASEICWYSFSCSGSTHSLVPSKSCHDQRKGRVEGLSQCYRTRRCQR
ncbi:hypothetical protein SCHPADRAFT_501109 [Schizopora paradoxa]|uniref:Uncharacterized protein n=1 Tax=Schizopora paradoxa TaxID=27342 RepID=A0A0H2RG51_9AGAM|nr:hypothetical protein SCHPADRAFT_501109 [Schizopora paradoxa]